MASYNRKSEARLCWEDVQKEVTLTLDKILRRVKNTVLAEMSDEFDAALIEGAIIEVGTNTDEIKRLVAKTVRKELGTGK